MASVINTNVSSLNAQKNLATTNNALQTSLQRLSSGLRINSAKDDAAGMAISSRMTAQINGLNQASRNANDGVSLSQTAEGAMAAIGDNLQRMRELAVQSVNATNSAVDRTTMDAEVQALSAEIDRVASQTAFNGVKVIDGSFAAQNFQVGANSGETIQVASIASLRTSAMGATTSASLTGATLTGAAALGASDIGFQVGGTITMVNAAVNGANGKANTSAYSIANAINSVSAGVTATAGSTTVTNALTATGGALADTGTFTINSVTITIAAGALGNSGTTDEVNVMNAINTTGQLTHGVLATDDGTGHIKLTAADGRNIVVAGFGATVTAAKAGLGTAATAGTTYGTVTLNSPTDFVIKGNNPTRAGSNFTTDLGVSAVFNGSTVSQLNVLSASTANSAIQTIDAALATVNNARAQMGAVQNRFMSAVSTIATTSENLSAARSRIQDADFAQETAALTRNQILSQAGTAMLAQANQLPQSVLSLLK